MAPAFGREVTRRHRRPLCFGRAVWLLPAAFALHVLEEAPGFNAWARRYASERYTQRDFIRNNLLGLALTAGTTALASRNGKRPLFLLFYSTILTPQALFNPVFHVGTTVAYRAYSPGLFTSLGLFLPVWHLLTRLALQERLITARGVLGAAAIGGLTHGATVAQQVYFIGVPEHDLKVIEKAGMLARRLRRA